MGAMRTRFLGHGATLITGPWALLPSTSTIVQIGVVPANNVNIGIDTNGPVEIASLTFNNSLTGTVTIVADGTETLQVDGVIANNSSNDQDLDLKIISGADATYNGGPTGGSLTFGQNLTIGSHQIQTLGTVNVTGELAIDINGNTAGSFGTIGNIVTSNTTQIGIGGTYANTATVAANTGDFFQLTSGNFAGATVNILPSFVNNVPNNGLLWVTSLIQKGILYVEPTQGGTTINTGTVLPVGNDSEFNTNGGIILNGGQLLTSDNGTLDTGGTLGAAFSTGRTIAVNTTGGTIAATTGTVATYTNSAVVSNGNGTTGTLTIGSAGNAGTVIFQAANTYTGPTAVVDGTFELDGSLAAGSAVTLASGTTLSGSGTVGGTTAMNGATVNGSGLTLTGATTVNGSGNTITGTVTSTGGVSLGQRRGAGAQRCLDRYQPDFAGRRQWHPDRHRLGGWRGYPHDGRRH